MKKILNKIGAFILIFIIFFGMVTVSVETADNEGELTGERIIIDFTEEDDEEFVVEGDAVLIYRDLSVEGDYARHNTEAGYILFEDNVIIEDEEYVITGDLLEGNLEEEDFHITGDVELKGDEFLVGGDSLDYKHYSGEMIFSNNTYINYKDFRAEADKINYKRGEDRIVLTGNVRGSRDGREFTASRVTADLENEKITLEEGARIIFPDNGGEE